MRASFPAARLGPVERGEHVFEDAEVGEDALAFPVAGNISDLVARGVGKRIDRVEAAVLADDDRPRSGRALHARKHAHKVGLPVAVESGDPEDLAMMEPEVDLAAARPDLHHVGFHDDAAPQGVLRAGATGLTGAPRCWL